jgi:hypothetical protein
MEQSSTSQDESRANLMRTYSEFMAHLNNQYRQARMILQSMLASELRKWGDAPGAAETIHQSLQIRRELALEVCASVPLVYRPPANSPNQSPAYSRCPNRSPSPMRTTETPRMGHGYFLLWPLFVAGADACIPKEMSLWVAACLQNMFRISGIKSARRLSQGILNLCADRDSSRSWT